VPIPIAQRWLFWDVDPTKIDLRRDARYVIPRVLERGRLVDVQWLLRRVGDDRIHRFFRDEGSAELSAKTINFWRAYFRAWNEPWAEPPAFRRHSALPWPV
jgi:hypothetical protein